MMMAIRNLLLGSSCVASVSTCICSIRDGPVIANDPSGSPLWPGSTAAGWTFSSVPTVVIAAVAAISTVHNTKTLNAMSTSVCILGTRTIEGSNVHLQRFSLRVIDFSLTRKMWLVHKAPN